MKKFCLWPVALSLMLTLGACGTTDSADPSTSPSPSPSAAVSENPGSVTDEDGFVDDDDRENSVTEDDRNGGQDSDWGEDTGSDLGDAARDVGDAIGDTARDVTDSGREH
jgi:hypothetical protein